MRDREGERKTRVDTVTRILDNLSKGFSPGSCVHVSRKLRQTTLNISSHLASMSASKLPNKTANNQLDLSSLHAQSYLSFALPSPPSSSCEQKVGGVITIATTKVWVTWKI